MGMCVVLPGIGSTKEDSAAFFIFRFFFFLKKNCFFFLLFYFFSLKKEPWTLTIDFQTVRLISLVHYV